VPSQFFGLNISYTGLLAANAALNTTANNISNVETEGYSRQEAIQEASAALRVFTTYGCAGSGVDTIAIERIHDDFYDDKFRDSNQKLGRISAKAYYMKSVENYFQETDTINGFNSSFNLMYNALEEVQKNAGDKATKAQFVMYAQSLCDYFNGVANQLSELQKDVNTEIKDTVSEINSIASQIATLNKQINVIELTGAKANELRDKRTLLLDKLSEYVSCEVTETPIRDEANNYDTGANRFVVTIAGNQLLVDTNEFREIECNARENNETMNQSDTKGLYDLGWTDGNTFNIYSTLIGGKLQGLIEMRDGNNTENFRGVVKNVDTQNSTVKIQVTDDYLKDLDKCTLATGGGKISLGSETYHYTDWTYEYNKTTGECFYTFNIDPNYDECILSTSRLELEANVGKSIDFQGIPYYQEQLNEFVRLYSRTFNDILTQNNSVDGYKNPATRLFFADNVLGGQLTFDDYYANSTGNIVTISNSDDSYYRLTAANFEVSDYIAQDANRLATRTGASDGESKSDVVDQLIALKTDKTMFSFRGGSASEFLQSVLSDVALNASRANRSETYYSTMTKTVNNQRISISGVDSDEEAISLVKFQNAYDLASRMIQTFTEIYDRLILQTGV
jgi:flagellar hook-associated protein 1 FlgK